MSKPAQRQRSRSGKIARLPFVWRERVCRWLLDGVPHAEIARQLNADPDVRETLRRYSTQRRKDEVNAENVSNWYHGGYREWLERREKRVSGGMLQ